MKAECYYAIERNGAEYELAITGTVQPITRGRYSGPAELCYPDEGGEVEIDSANIMAVNGEPCSATPIDPDELTNREIDAIEDLLRDAACVDDDRDPPSYDWADENDRYEAQTERDRWADDY